MMDGNGVNRESGEVTMSVPSLGPARRKQEVNREEKNMQRE